VGTGARHCVLRATGLIGYVMYKLLDAGVAFWKARPRGEPKALSGDAGLTRCRTRPARGLRGLAWRRRGSSRRRGRRSSCHRGLQDRGPPCDRGAPAPDPSQLTSPHSADFGLRARSTRCWRSCCRAVRPGSAVNDPQLVHNAIADSKRRREPHRSHFAAGRRAPVVPGRSGGLSQRGLPSCTRASTSITSPGCSGAFTPVLREVLVHQRQELVTRKVPRSAG